VNTWKVILATMIIFGTGVVTGGLLVRHTVPVPPARPARNVGTNGNSRPFISTALIRVEFLKKAERELNLNADQKEQAGMSDVAVCRSRGTTAWRRCPAVAAIAMLLCGCMPVPSRYRVPQREYAPNVEHVSVSGFVYGDMVQTGGSSGYVTGQGVVGASNSWQGEYHQESDARFFRHALENTRCVRSVDEDRNRSLHIEGEEGWDVHHGAVLAGGVLEILTLLPIVGVPLVDNADGWASARLYRNGEYVKEYGTTRAHFLYLTTLYTFRQDTDVAASRVRAMALRDLADKVAADLCGADAAPGSAAGSPNSFRQR